MAWVNQELRELTYPLLADFTKQVSKEYGVLLERLGAALRATFLIGPDGLVRAYMVQDLTVGRSVDEILRLVSALATGKLCPAGWRPGEPHLPPIQKNTGNE
jgi:peroxiredoxin (alkyl hydroperoxide reductase subunit C)